jgi:ATP-dependent Lon protease
MLQSQLGDVDPLEREVIDTMRRIEVADMPARVAAAARTEVERLRTVGGVGAEASEIRSYVDWLVHLPWRQTATAGPTAIDLDVVKESPWTTRCSASTNRRTGSSTTSRSPSCAATSAARSRASSDRRTSASHRSRRAGARPRPAARAASTWAAAARHSWSARGALAPARSPARSSALLRDVGVRATPLIMLQEMDEIGLGKVEGDPIEAMEEVLDWDNRTGFVDRYIDLPFDLSDAIFIATAQDFYRVPRDLRELMVEIRIAGYTPEEKVDIARRKLLPRLIDEHGLHDGIEFTDDGLSFLAYGYARDAGVAMLRRALETLLRTRARARTAGDTSRWIMDPNASRRSSACRATRRPRRELARSRRGDRPGVDRRRRRADVHRGAAHARLGRLIITGMLGEVMRESVNAAYSYVRSRGEELRITEEDFRESDIHVHFPVGAIPKDGPSAGIAVTLAIASTLSNRPVRHDIAMTGEVTLRGKVLEIGGVKEKVLAAHRAGHPRCDPAARQRAGPARRPRGRARRHPLPLRRADGRGDPARALQRKGGPRRSAAGRRRVRARAPPATEILSQAAQGCRWRWDDPRDAAPVPRLHCARRSSRPSGHPSRSRPCGSCRGSGPHPGSARCPSAPARRAH